MKAHHQLHHLRGILGAAGAAALFLAPAAIAAGDEYKQQQSQQSQQSSGQMGSASGAQSEQVKGVIKTAKGNVEHIDLKKGQISLRLTDEIKAEQAGMQPGAKMEEEPKVGETLTLNARPFDLERLDPGAVKTLRFYDYEGERWLAPAKGVTVSSIEKGGYKPQTAQGEIENLDHKTGEVTINGESYKAHPEQTKDLQPGQFVSLSFADFNDNQWVASVKPSKAGQMSEEEKRQKEEQKQMEQGSTSK